MPAPTHEHIKEMGPEVYPFERKNDGSKVGTGEDIVFQKNIYNATDEDGGRPENTIIVKRDEIETNKKYGKYLWVIDKNGLCFILEATSNPAASRGFVCHTNITGGGQALQGGELWFGENNYIYINFWSGRYGASTINHSIGVVEYFKFVGYSKVEVLDPLFPQSVM